SYSALRPIPRTPGIEPRQIPGMKNRQLSGAIPLSMVCSKHRREGCACFDSASSRFPMPTACVSINGMQQPKPKTILVVEDHKLNMKLFCDLLGMRHHSVFQAIDGVEALKLARQHKPDLILMDIQLPGVSGLEIVKWMREDDSLRAIPIVAITAFAMQGDEERIRAGGCDGYLAKPISAEGFLRVVDQFLMA